MAFCKSLTKILPYPHGFSRRTHFRPQNGIDTCKFIERKNGFFNGEIVRNVFSHSLFFQRYINHTTSCNFSKRNPCSLCKKRDCPRSTRIDFKHIDFIPLNCKLGIN
nr:carbamyl-phosphte synthase small chain [Candidatus Coxiella mudrowiae]